MQNQKDATSSEEPAGRRFSKSGDGTPKKLSFDLPPDGTVPAERVSKVANDMIDKVLDKYGVKSGKDVSTSKSSPLDNTTRNDNDPRRSSNARKSSDTKESSYLDLQKLGSCLDCKWKKNYHPCLLSGHGANDVCKLEMSKKGYPYEDPQSEKCGKYRAGRFYALHKNSQIDTEIEAELQKRGLSSREDDTDIRRQKSREKASSMDSQGSGPKQRPLSRSPSKQKSKGKLQSPSSKPSKTRIVSGPKSPKRTESKMKREASVKNLVKKQSSHAHVHYAEKGTCEPGEVCPSRSQHGVKPKSHQGSKDEYDDDLEYIHKLHPHPSSHAQEVARDTLVPLPDHIPSREAIHYPKTEGKKRFQPEMEDPSKTNLPPTTMSTTDIKCGLHEEGEDCKLNSSQNKKEQPKGREGVEVQELYELGRNRPCEWGKNYHPCNNPYNRADVEKCKLWKQQCEDAGGPNSSASKSKRSK